MAACCTRRSIHFPGSAGEDGLDLGNRYDRVLAETAIRVTEMQPGLTRTNIILTRYRGDREKEKDYFDQFKMALDPADIARSIVFALDQPPHVQIAEMMILPVNRY